MTDNHDREKTNTKGRGNNEGGPVTRGRRYLTSQSSPCAKMDRSEPLIPVGGISRESRGPDRFSTVLLPSVVASLAALNFGFTLGYTSPTETELTKDLLSSDGQFTLFTVSQEVEDQFLKLCKPRQLAS